MEGEEEAEVVDEGAIVPVELEGDENVEISLHALRGLPIARSRLLK